MLLQLQIISKLNYNNKTLVRINNLATLSLLSGTYSFCCQLAVLHPCQFYSSYISITEGLIGRLSTCIM